jgi:hypothetical protein
MQEPQGDQRKVKVAICKDCGGWILAGAYPKCEERKGGNREYNKLKKEGHRLDVITLGEHQQLVSCYEQHPIWEKAQQQVSVDGITEHGKQEVRAVAELIGVQTENTDPVITDEEDVLEVMRVNRRPSVPDMAAVAKELIDVKFFANDTLQEAKEQFYQIMRKHGIKQGTPIYGKGGEIKGYEMANFEWTMARTLFLDRLVNYLTWEEVSGETIPPDLRG